MRFEDVPSGLEGFEQCCTSNGKVWQGTMTKKGHGDLNVLTYNNSHQPPLLTDPKNQDVEIVGAAI